MYRVGVWGIGSLLLESNKHEAHCLPPKQVQNNRGQKGLHMHLTRPNARST